MARLPQLLVVLALIGATAAAFAVTEQLKLERSPITATRVDKVFSPVCRCETDLATISFVLRRAETVTVQMLDADGETVRTLARGRREPAGQRVTYAWDGRDEAGRVVPDASYRPRVLLRRHGRTVVLPNQIRVDSTVPRIRVVRVAPRVFSPDGDRQRDRVTAWYEIDEPARALMLVDGRRLVLKQRRTTSGTLVWYGRIDGHPARPGVHVLRLRAVDQAGNLSPRTRPVAVVVRYVALSRDEIEVVAGKRFSVRVLTDARRYAWLFAARRGVGTEPALVLRAPLRPGRYTLFVTVRDRAASARVVVTRPPRPQPR